MNKRENERQKERDNQRNAGRFQMGNQCEGFSSSTVNKQQWHSEQNKDFPIHRAAYPQKTKMEQKAVFSLKNGTPAQG